MKEHLDTGGLKILFHLFSTFYLIPFKFILLRTVTRADKDKERVGRKSSKPQIAIQEAGAGVEEGEREEKLKRKYDKVMI